MKSATTIISDFVLERLPERPVHERITLTRALAAVEPCKKKQAALRAIADQFEETERAHHQLLLNFRKRGGAA